MRKNQNNTTTLGLTAAQVAQMMPKGEWPQIEGYEFESIQGDRSNKLYKLTYRAIESEVKTVRRGTRRDTSDKAAQERAAKRLAFQRKLAAGVATASVIVTAVIASLPM